MAQNHGFARRWEWLEGVRAQTAAQWAVTEMAKILLQELASWPSDVAWADSASEGRYRELFAAEARTPSSAAITEAIARTRWELTHDDEALEHYRRNDLLERACPEPYDQLASAFIETYLTEALLELIERTENRLKRRDAVSCLDQLEALFRLADR